MSPIIARVIDSLGEIDYPLEDAKHFEKTGTFRYVGYRRYGDVLEHIYRFE